MVLRRRIWLAVFLAIVSPGFSQEEKHQEQPTRQYEHATSPAPNADQSNADQRPANAEHKNPNVTGYLNAIERHGEFSLVVVTFVLAVVTAFLWWATRSLVKGAEDTAKRQLRAYVWISLADIQYLGIKVPIHGNIQVSNDGQTPAHQLTGWARIEAGPEGLTGKKSIAGPCVVGPRGYIVLRPKSGRVLTREEYSQVINGDLAIRIVGEICYTDSFGQEQSSTFRYRYQGEGVQYPHEEKLGLNHEAEGNKSN